MSVPGTGQANGASWLAGEYQAVVFEDAGHPIGYGPVPPGIRACVLAAVFCRERALAGRGIGRAAIDWLRQHAWRADRCIRLDVLVGNRAGISFWHAVGFRDYCLTLELESGVSIDMPA